MSVICTQTARVVMVSGSTVSCAATGNDGVQRVTIYRKPWYETCTGELARGKGLEVQPLLLLHHGGPGAP